MSDFDMFRVPFYYNYEDYFPNLNDSVLDEFDLFDELSDYDGVNDINHQPETNRNLTDSISSIHSLLSILTNNSGMENTSISLSDIILSHHLDSIISQQSNKTNYIERPIHLNEPEQFYLPPWENLTTIQKDAILKSALGEPQKYSNVTVLSLTAYYGAILSVGIPGNALTLLIIITNSYMRTAPNIFLLNVALADLLTLTLGKYLSYTNSIISILFWNLRRKCRNYQYIRNQNVYIAVVPIEVKMLFKSYPWPFGEIGCYAATTICELLTHVLIVTMIAFSLER